MTASITFIIKLHICKAFPFRSDCISFAMQIESCRKILKLKSRDAVIEIIIDVPSWKNQERLLRYFLETDNSFLASSRVFLIFSCSQSQSLTLRILNQLEASVKVSLRSTSLKH